MLSSKTGLRLAKLPMICSSISSLCESLLLPVACEKYLSQYVVAYSPGHKWELLSLTLVLEGWCLILIEVHQVDAVQGQDRA